MKNSEKIEILASTNNISTEIKAVGGGEWAIEVYSENNFLFELVGSNGTHYEADDLWGELAELKKEAAR